MAILLLHVMCLAYCIRRLEYKIWMKIAPKKKQIAIEALANVYIETNASTKTTYRDTFLRV